MFLGIATCAYSALLYNSSSQLPTSEGSHIKVNNLIAAFVMYASYFVLFAKFAWDYAERLGIGRLGRGWTRGSGSVRTKGGGKRKEKDL
jgi:hypothetical protein